MSAPTSRHEELAGFIKRVLHTSPHANELVIVHRPRRGADEELETIIVSDPLDYAGEDKLNELVDTIVDTCQRDADSQSARSSSYYVRADFAGRSRRSPLLRFSNEEEDGETDNSLSDMLRAQMKQNEQYAKAIMHMGPGVVEAQGRTLARLTEARDHADEMRLKMFEVLEELASKKDERERAARRELRRDKIVQRAIDGVMPLAMATIGKKLLGAKAPAHVKNSAEFRTLAEALKSIPQETLARWMGELDPLVAVSLLEALKSFSDEPEEKPKDKKKAVKDGRPEERKLPEPSSLRGDGPGFH